LNHDPLQTNAWVDPTLSSFIQVASRDSFERIARDVNTELSRELRSQSGLSPLFEGRDWQAEQLLPLLKSSHDFVLKRLVRHANKWNARRWLWYSRRLPWWVFPASSEAARGEGRYDTYAESLLDAITAQHGSELVTPPKPPRFEYSLEPSSVKKVLTFCAGVTYLTGIQRLLLAAGRGSTFYGKHRGTSLPLEGREYLRQRTIYIKRLVVADTWQGPFIASGASTNEVSDPASPDSLWMAVKLIDPRSFPVPFEDDVPPELSYARFFFYSRNLDPIRAIATSIDNTTTPWHTEYLPAILVMLRLAKTMISDPYSLPTFYHYGYVTASLGFWREYLTSGFERARAFAAELLPSAQMPQNPDELVGLIKSLPVGTWPIRRGKAIRTDGERVTIDVYGITVSLKDNLMIHSSVGTIGQLRGRKFEDDVQVAIDGTSWRPPDDVRSIRRRQLRLGGQFLTDIDAMGVSANRLLIVSCKSKGLTPQLEIASAAATKNVEAMIEAAFVAAIRLEDRLNANRFGDNFDFSKYDEIKVRVCIPFPMFLTSDRLLEPIDRGLMRCASLAELHTWLTEGEIDLEAPLSHRGVD
jgi:hypothetical protein